MNLFWETRSERVGDKDMHLENLPTLRYFINMSSLRNSSRSTDTQFIAGTSCLYKLEGVERYKWRWMNFQYTLFLKINVIKWCCIFNTAVLQILPFNLFSCWGWHCRSSIATTTNNKINILNTEIHASILHVILVAMIWPTTGRLL